MGKTPGQRRVLSLPGCTPGLTPTKLVGDAPRTASSPWLTFMQPLMVASHQPLDSFAVCVEFPPDCKLLGEVLPHLRRASFMAVFPSKSMEKLGQSQGRTSTAVHVHRYLLKFCLPLLHCSLLSRCLYSNAIMGRQSRDSKAVTFLLLFNLG